MGIGHPYQTRFKEISDYTYSLSVDFYWKRYHAIVNRVFGTLAILLGAIFLHMVRFDFGVDPNAFSLFQAAVTVYISVVSFAVTGLAAAGVYGLSKLRHSLVKYYTARDISEYW